MPRRRRGADPQAIAAERAKYESAREDFGLEHPELDVDQLGQIARCQGVLRHAIESQLDGFRVGDVIGVAVAAEGLGTSRATLGQSIDPLVAEGFLAAESRNAPYRIVSARPLLPPPQAQIGKTVSITKETAGQGGKSAMLARMLPVGPGADVGAEDDFFRALLTESLQNSWDQAITGALLDPASRKRWFDSDLYAFFRVRHIPRGAPPRRKAWLAEISYVAVSDENKDRIEGRLAGSTGGAREQASLPRYLELIAKFKGLTGGRSRLRVDSLPPEVVNQVRTLTAPTRLDLSPLVGETPDTGPLPPLLRWEYGHFALEPPGLVLYTICWLDPEVVQVYIREYGFEVDERSLATLLDEEA